MTRRSQAPDPLDPFDPRVKVQDVDQLGQTFGPGDYVCSKGYHGLNFGKVLMIQALRNNGSPLSGGKKVHYHACTKDVHGVWRFLYYDRKTDWDANTRTYLTSVRTPITHAVRHPTQELIKIDVLTDEIVKDEAP